MNDAKTAARIAVATEIPVAAMPHVPSRDDRYAKGKALRDKLPRKDQGVWKAHDKRQIRLRSFVHRTPNAFRNWSRSATAGCCSRPSPSIAVRQR